jgi:hypothetical protein
MYAIVTTYLDSVDEEGVTSKVPHYTVVDRRKGRDVATFLTREDALAHIKSLI